MSDLLRSWFRVRHTLNLISAFMLAMGEVSSWVAANYDGWVITLALWLHILLPAAAVLICAYVLFQYGIRIMPLLILLAALYVLSYSLTSLKVLL